MHAHAQHPQMLRFRTAVLTKLRPSLKHRKTEPQMRAVGRHVNANPLLPSPTSLPTRLAKFEFLYPRERPFQTDSLFPGESQSHLEVEVVSFAGGKESPSVLQAWVKKTLQLKLSDLCFADTDLQGQLRGNVIVCHVFRSTFSLNAYAKICRCSTKKTSL